MMSFTIICKGCSAEFTCTPIGLEAARQHETQDVCCRKGDREADAWDLDWRPEA